MEQKKALIIGASGAIGFESAKMLHQKGFQLILTYSNGKEKIMEKLKGYNIKNYEVVHFDSRDKKSIIACAGQIAKTHGHIDCILYSVSAPLVNKAVFDVEWEDIQEHLETQVQGLLYLIKSMKDTLLKKARVKFIVILTEACFGKPPTMLSHYVLSKYALMGYTKCLSAELSRYNCTFNMVSPGMVETPLISSFPSKLAEMAAEQNPMKRIAKPEDVANVIAFLASDEADYINGANILVNGGNIIN